MNLNKYCQVINPSIGWSIGTHKMEGKYIMSFLCHASKKWRWLQAKFIVINHEREKGERRIRKIPFMESGTTLLGFATMGWQGVLNFGIPCVNKVSSHNDESLYRDCNYLQP